jgi:membrane-associated phospholipid phosphatase
MSRTSVATASSALAVSLAVLLAVLVVVRYGPLDTLDRRLYARLGAGASADRYLPGFTNYLGKPIVVIPIAVVLALVARRCRVLAAGIPSAVVITGLVVFGMTWLTARERPELGAHAGEHNSFPGGHAAQVTLLFGLLLLVATTLIARAWLRALICLVASLVFVPFLADIVRTGGHWPTDQLAGVLIAAAMLSTVKAHLDEVGAHADCGPRCPMKVLRHDPE